MSYLSTILADSPLFAWMLDETSGTTVADASGNGHTGTYVGSPTLGKTSLIPQDTGTSVGFTATQYATTATVAALQPASASVELWVRITNLDSAGLGAALFSFGQSAGLICGYWVSPIEMRFYRYSGSYGYGSVNPMAYFADGGRHHVVQTYDQANLKLYIDNVLVLTQALTGALGYGGVGGGITINGYYGGSSYASYPGITIDGVSVYGAALTAAQVNTHYTAGVGGATFADGYAPTTSDPYATAVLADSPTGYWRGGEPTNVPGALDASGHHNGGVYESSWTRQVAALPTNTGGDLAVQATANTARINLGVNTNLHAPNSAAIEYWLNFTSFPGAGGNYSIFSQGKNGGLLSALYGGSTDIRFYRNSGGAWVYLTVNPATVFGTGTRHHVVHVYDSTAGFIYLYVDSVLVASTAATGALSYSNDDPDAINYYFASGGGHLATVDEVAYYSTALSAARVRAHYLAGLIGTAVQGGATVAGNGIVGSPPSQISAGANATGSGVANRIFVPGVTRGAWRVTMQGVDITAQCRELDFSCQDTLGQGPGVAAGSVGRATTAVLRTSLGPAASAVGAGTKITTPTLVRQGEVRVYDSTGMCVFGGYATDIADQVGIKESGRSTIYTDVNCHDYWQDLDRYNVVSEVFDGQTDVYVIKYLLNKYAPNINTALLPASTNQLGPLNFKNVTLQKCIQRIADKTGYAVWIDYNKAIHYVAPGQFANAPFALSQTPDFLSSFQMGFDSYSVDDASAINRVTFYGGKHLSQDYTQDLSPQANGSADTLTLAYYPHKAADGKYHAYIGGVEQVLGYYGDTGLNNTLKKNGGNCDVLLNTDAHVLIYNTPPSNTGVNSVTAKYRFETPLVVQVTDAKSYAFYGRYLDGTIHDDTVFDPHIAVARCRVLLNEQSMGLTTLKVRTFKAGLQAGMLLRVDHNDRNIHGNFLIQEVSITPKGAGFFEYTLSCGAWHWNMVDFVMSTAHAASPQDQTTTETETATVIQPMNESAHVTESWATTAQTTHNFVWGTSKWGLSSY